MFSKQVVLGGLVVVCGAVGLISSSATTAAPNPEPPRPAPLSAPAASAAFTESRALSGRPTVSFSSADGQKGYASVGELERVGAALESRTPTPPGSPSDVDWGQAAAQGGDSLAGMQAVVEYNATCKWYQHVSDRNALDREIAPVISSFSAWPSFRGTFKATVADEIAKAAIAGDLGPLKLHTEANC